MKNILVILFVVISLIGCAMPPTASELANADYGPYPNDYEQIIRAQLNMTLKDPESARINFLRQPQSGWNGIGGTIKYGWFVCADINAKNSFGGYTGSKLTYFLIKNNAVVQTLVADNGNPIMQGMVNASCGIK